MPRSRAKRLPDLIRVVDEIKHEGVVLQRMGAVQARKGLYRLNPGQPLAVKAAVKKITFFPPLWAVILGLGFNLLNISLGPVIDNTTNYLGQGAIPLIMIALGLSIDFSAISRSKSMIAFTSVIKLAFFPLVAFVIASQISLVDLQYNVSIVEAAMPSGMMSLLLAITYKLDYELTSDCILINTVIFLITLPIIIMLI